jgi:hypothetical protein
MSTIDRRKPTTLPPLVAGQRLDRATFHERYEAMPPATRAELIGGIVHMPSPLSSDHGDENSPVVYWLTHYQRFTRGVRTTINATTFLDDQAEPLEPSDRSRRKAPGLRTRRCSRILGLQS